MVDGQSVLKGGRDYGQTPIDYRLGDFDHQMYLDTAVEPTTTYYYRVCAVDAAGQKGPFSREVRATTKAADPLAGARQGNYGPVGLRAGVRRGAGDRRLARSILRLDLKALRRRNQGEAQRRVVGIPVPGQQKALVDRA